MRTLIDLPKSQLEDLQAVCKRDNLSRAEAIRRAVALYLQHCTHPAPEAAFGLWKKHAKDGVAYQRAMREEW